MKYFWTSLNDNFHTQYGQVQNQGFTKIGFTIDYPMKDCIDLSKYNLVQEDYIDTDFTFEYHNIRYGNESVISNLYPIANRLYSAILQTFKKDDIIITPNSGDYSSRLIAEMSHLIGYKHYYFENFFFKKFYQVSNKPFITSDKYGKSELEELYEIESKLFLDNTDFWVNYFHNKETKFSQKLFELPGITFDNLAKEYDSFFVGQMKYDTNIILPKTKYTHTEQMVLDICKKNPSKKYVYKPHPWTYDLDQIEDIKNLSTVENLDIVNNNIHDIIAISKEIHTISSTVGIEAELTGSKVNWYCDNWYTKLDLNRNLDNKHRFLNTCDKYMFRIEELTNRI